MSALIAMEPTDVFVIMGIWAAHTRSFAPKLWKTLIVEQSGYLTFINESLFLAL